MYDNSFVVWIVINKAKIFEHICGISREDPPNRLAKMGAMATPFRVSDRAAEDTPPVPPEREEPRAETPPGKHVSFLLFDLGSSATF